MQRRGHDLLYGIEIERDPLTDIVSHLLATLAYSEKGESVGCQDDFVSYRAKVSRTLDIGIPKIIFKVL